MNQTAFNPASPSADRGALHCRLVRRGPWVAAGALACLAVFSSAGCAGDSDFDAAVRANSVSAFDDYLRLHPDGAHAAEARTLLAALVEDREWQRARAAGNSDSYQQYLRGYPSGAHAHDALTAIAELNLAAVPSTEASSAEQAAIPAAPAPAASPAAKGPIARAGAPAAPAAPRAASPKAAASLPAKAAAPKETHAAPTAAAGVRIQLGAFGTKSGAEGAWHRLAARYPELASRTPLIAAANAADGHAIERLQVGGFSKESAQAMCAALATHHDACFVMPVTGASAN